MFKGEKITHATYRETWVHFFSEWGGLTSSVPSGGVSAAPNLLGHFLSFSASSAVQCFTCWTFQMRLQQVADFGWVMPIGPTRPSPESVCACVGVCACVLETEKERERVSVCLFAFFVCLLATKPQCHQGDQMLFPPSLITSSYGLALFSCPLVSKPSCQTVLFQGISHSHLVKRLLYWLSMSNINCRYK